jgi:flagellar FliL protein
MVDSEPAKETAGNEAPAKKTSPLVPMLVSSLIMVGAAYAVVSFVLKPMIHPSQASVADAAEADAEGKGEIVRFENIIVNPSGTMGSRYLSTTVGLEVMSEESREAVREAEPMIKDALITYLSSRTIEELTDPATRELMRETIRQRVNPVIAPQQVRAIYFLDFVLQ